MLRKKHLKTINIEGSISAGMAEGQIQKTDLARFGMGVRFGRNKQQFQKHKNKTDTLLSPKPLKVLRMIWRNSQ